MHILFHDVHEQSTRRTFYRLQYDLVLRRHGRVREFQSIKVQHAVQDLVCGDWSALHQYAQTVEGRCHD
jgi:hypothetical protein